MFKKFAVAAVIAASFAAAPAHATFWVKHGHGDYGCGGHGQKNCESPLQGDYTYDGKGGDIKDATEKKVYTSRHNYYYETVPSIFTSSINVGESFTIADVNLSLNALDHERWSDLKISLSHSGTLVWLTTNDGGSRKADGTFIFDDAGLNEISYNNWKSGTYNPEGSSLLSAFNGTNSQGLWTLTVYDTVKNGKDGELCDWTLQLTPTSEVPEPATWAMMIAGFGMVGFQLRRRRYAPATVRA